MNKAEAAIQHLCSQGFDSPLMMPRLLSLLHGYIPSFANVFFWFDEKGRIRDIYDENPESYAVLPTFLEEHYNKKEREVWCGIETSAMYHSAHNIDQLWTVDRKTLYMHDFYNDFLRQIGNHWGLHKPIWVNDKAKGLLLLKRTADDDNFSNEDTLKLERISVHIEHAFSLQKYKTESFGKKAIEKGVLIVDTLGKVQNYTNKAERIMMLSQGEQNFNTYSQYTFSTLPPKLMALMKRLHSINSNDDALPSTEIIKNQWGKFKFSMYPLKANSGDGSNCLYMLQIEHFKPLHIMLFDRVSQYELTNRQSQICMNIGLGKSYSNIAVNLGIMESTVISHKKEIFRKLGVFDRHELSEKVLSK